MADTFRRPAVETELHPDLTDQVLIELPFPAELSVTDRLIDAYNNELRVPGEIIFVLDVSGSMAGARLADLQETMLQLIDGSASTTTAAVGLRDREQVTILPSASDVNQVTTATIGSPGTEAELRDSVEELVPEGGTALYSALQDAYGRMSVEEGGSILSLVLLTDGEVTEGPDAQQFGAWFEHQEADLPPTFVIRYGEADPAEMQQVAELTGGQLFDAGEDQLSETSQ